MPVAPEWGQCRRGVSLRETSVSGPLRKPYKMLTRTDQFFDPCLTLNKAQPHNHRVMELTLIIIAFCLIAGSLVIMGAVQPRWLPELRGASHADAPIERQQPGKRSGQNFSLRNTLIIIGPHVNHATCRLQRRLIKPAVPLLIREDVAIMEIYGDGPPRKNGEALKWLDPSLLRHALDAEEGFAIVYVGDDGKTVFRRQSPMLTEMIAERAGLSVIPPKAPQRRGQSEVLRHLHAA